MFIKTAPLSFFLVLFAFVAISSAQRVTFDVPTTIACDVTQGDLLGPKHKICTAKLPISLVLSASLGDEVSQCEIEVMTLDRIYRVVDYAPKTELVSEVVGTIKVSEESGKQVSGQIGGGGSFDHVVHAEASASNSKRDSSSKHFEQRPSLRMLSTSGTIHRGTGAYFKLRKTPQSTLEGTKEYRVDFSVADFWRAGVLRIVCRPTVTQGDRTRTLPAQSFLVPIHRHGDPEAAELAFAVINSQRKLIELTRSRQAYLQKLQTPSLAHHLKLTQPKLPPNWLQQTLWQPIDAGRLSFERRLPPPIQAAINDYRQSRLALKSLGETDSKLATQVASGS